LGHATAKAIDVVGRYSLLVSKGVPWTYYVGTLVFIRSPWEMIQNAWPGSNRRALYESNWAKSLYERLSQLGLPLLETNDEFDVNQTLAEVIKSKDNRLWEGFPVLLVNAANDFRFAYERVLEHLDNNEQRKTLHSLLQLSLTLYDLNHLSFSWTKPLREMLTANEKADLKILRKELASGKSFTLNGLEFHSLRLKNAFELYFEKDAEKSRQQKEKHEELSLEYALSQVFSPKQKELFKKRLEGLPLTKTEKEYYSRTVKKKVVALANPELHRLAQRLMAY
jgi:uncharacterized protein with von Willebrand factor type A (vWA) domain